MRPSREFATPTLAAPTVAFAALAFTADPYGPEEYAEPLVVLLQPAAISTIANGTAAAMNTVILRFMRVLSGVTGKAPTEEGPARLVRRELHSHRRARASSPPALPAKVSRPHVCTPRTV